MSAATEQDLCKTVLATDKVNWATTFDRVIIETPRCVGRKYKAWVVIKSDTREELAATNSS